jgi:uronate dehydrogenase
MTIKAHHTLLLTGAAGGLGTALRERLKSNCDVLRLSARGKLGTPREGEEIVVADLANAQEVSEAVKGCQAIVHMGGMSTEGPFDPILQGNIVGVYNLYEAARQHGVKRIIFASSNHVTGFYRQNEVITPEHPVRPDGLYGVSKAFGESLSRMYFDRYGIETACLRIGSSFAKPTDRRMLASWLSFDDLHRLITCCLTTPVLGHTIVYGVSDNAANWWDNSSVRHLGFVPQDSADVYRAEVFASTPEPDLSDPAVQFQGGGTLKAGIPMTTYQSGK